MDERLIGRLAAPILAAASRSQLLVARMEACLALSRPREVVAMFERGRLTRMRRVPAAALYLGSMAYSELGSLREAAALLRRAEEQHEAPDPLDLRRFTAYVRLYAQAGRPEAVDGFVKQHVRAAAEVSPAGLRMRMGLAHLRAGERERGMERLYEALTLLAENEDRLRAAIQRTIWEADQSSGPVAPDVDMLRDLDTLQRLQSRSKERPAFETMTGGRAPLTTAIILLLLVVWSLTEWAGSSLDARTLMRFGANVPELVRSGEWWRMIASVFLHVGALHLLFNAYACYLFGGFVERTAGRWEIWTVFVFSGLAGSATSALLGVYTISAGASGAIFGLLGAAVAVTLRFRRAFPRRMRRIYLFNFIFIAAAEMAYGMVEPHIDNLAHAGGMAAGLVLGAFVMPRGRDGARRRLFILGGLVAIAMTMASWAQCTANVKSGGYPERVPPMKRYATDSGRWQIRVPVFWELHALGPNVMTVFDPAGAYLKVERVQRMPFELGVELAVEEGVSIVSDGYTEIGGRTFREIVMTLTMNDPPERVWSYQTQSGTFAFVLSFQCLEEDAAVYSALLAPILEGFETVEKRGSAGLPSRGGQESNDQR